jgi:hypothetical protein
MASDPVAVFTACDTFISAMNRWLVCWQAAREMMAKTAFLTPHRLAELNLRDPNWQETFNDLRDVRATATEAAAVLMNASVEWLQKPGMFALFLADEVGPQVLTKEWPELEGEAADHARYQAFQESKRRHVTELIAAARSMKVVAKAKAATIGVTLELSGDDLSGSVVPRPPARPYTPEWVGPLPDHFRHDYVPPDAAAPIPAEPPQAPPAPAPAEGKAGDDEIAHIVQELPTQSNRRAGRLPKEDSEAKHAHLLSLLDTHSSLKDDPKRLAELTGLSVSSVRREINRREQKYLDSQPATSDPDELRDEE